MSIPFTWIYLIHDPYTGYYKIGKSDDPDVRLKQLCNPSSYGTIPAAPTQYRLIEAWLCPEQKEKEMHQDFVDCRVYGEWFDFKKHYEGSPFPAHDTDFVRKDLEEQYFRDNQRWLGEESLLEDEYYSLLESNKKLWERLHPPPSLLLLQASPEVIY